MKSRFLLAVLLLSPVSGYGNPLRAGAAKLNVTPPPEVPISGYYHEHMSPGIHDSLYAKTFVLECPGQKIAVVTCDLIEMPATLFYGNVEDYDQVPSIRRSRYFMQKALRENPFSRMSTLQYTWISSGLKKYQQI